MSSKKSLQKTNSDSIFAGPRPCAMIICGQLARAKAATDLRIFMCSGSLGFFYIAPGKGVFYLKNVTGFFATLRMTLHQSTAY